MLDHLSSLQLLGILVIIIILVLIIGTIGIAYTENKGIGDSAIHASKIFCGRGKDVNHEGFGIFYYILIVTASVLAISVIGVEIMRRAVSKIK